MHVKLYTQYLLLNITLAIRN